MDISFLTQKVCRNRQGPVKNLPGSGMVEGGISSEKEGESQIDLERMPTEKGVRVQGRGNSCKRDTKLKGGRSLGKRGIRGRVLHTGIKFCGETGLRGRFYSLGMGKV